MECKVIQGKLSPFLEGAVSLEEKRTIEEHLSGCQDCSIVLEDLKKAEVLVKGLEKVDPPAWLKQKVVARIRAEEERRKSLIQRLFYPLRVKVPIEAFATVLVALAAVYVFKAVEPETKRIPFPSSGSVASAPAEKVVSKREVSSSDKDDLKSTPSSSLPGQTKDVARKQASGVLPAPPATAKEEVSEKVLSEEDEGSLTQFKGEKERRVTRGRRMLAGETRGDAAKAETSKPIQTAPPPEPTLEKKAVPVEGRHKEATEAEEFSKPKAFSQKLPIEGQTAKEEVMAPKSPGAEKRLERRDKGVSAGATLSAIAEKRAKTVRFTVQVVDTNMAREEVEKVLGQLGGQRIETESSEDIEVISADLRSEKIKDFHDRLASVGEVKEKELPSDIPRGDIPIRIEIIRHH